MKVMKIIRKCWIYILLKNTIAVYAGQSVNPNSRIQDHKGKKDFDDFIIIDFPLEHGKMADIVEMDVIRRLGLIKKGQNEAFSHKTKYNDHKDEFVEIIQAFWNAIEKENFVYEVNVEDETLPPNYWENEFDEYLINGLFIGLSIEKWIKKNKKEYTGTTFYVNTIKLRHDYWKNEYEDFEASGESIEDWCHKRGYTLKMFNNNTFKFWNFDWEEEFNEYIHSGKSTLEFCSLKLYSYLIFTKETYQYRKKYWKNLYEEQQKSGLNPREWCLENGILLKIFTKKIINYDFINWKAVYNKCKKSGLNENQWCLENGYDIRTFEKYTDEFRY
ncbi:MAG: hypothetical protein CfClM3_1003 [Methanobrevibacter sp. CfCl-M3]